MPAADPRALLRRMFDAAVRQADPVEALAAHLPDPPRGRCLVLGAGKAAAVMARAVEVAWPNVDLSGLVITRYGHAVPTERIKVAEAAHPVPDDAGVAATQRILDLARETQADLVLVLISGGGSSLLTMPRPPVTLEEKIKVTRLLLRSGLSISDMNRVRRRLSEVKGGGLARALGGRRTVTLAISDVPGDDPLTIASGPTMLAEHDDDDLGDLVDRLSDRLPTAAVELLRQPSLRPCMEGVADFRLIASPMQSLLAAADVARSAGVTPLILGDALEGEAKELGIILAGVARSSALHNHPLGRPAVLLSGGETTVTIGTEAVGRGGRNTECLLAFARAAGELDGLHAISADTDGIDGTEDAAGAMVGPDTLNRARALGLDPARFLAEHDSYSFFDRLGDLIRIGPTLTNVNDFRAILLT